MIMSGQGWPAFPLPLQVDYRQHSCRAMRPTLTEVYMESRSKPCPRCGQVLRDQKEGRCIPCRKQSTKEYREKNREKINAKTKEWHSRADKSVLAAKKVEYNKNNAERMAAAKLEWQRNNREKVRGYAKASYEKNKDKHRERMRRQELAKRARIKLVGGKLSNGIGDRLIALQRGKCAICECRIVKYHMDHIMPIALGGMNIDENIQLLCPTCNLRKNAKHPIDYMQSLGRLL